MSEPLWEALDKLDASIEASLPPEKALARRREIENRTRAEREAVRTLTKACALAIEELAAAIQFPRIAVTDIESALEHCRRALVAAKELDA